MNLLVNTHSYLMLNAAIAFSYLFVKLILQFSWFANNLSQLQRLQFGRKIFVATLIIFLVTPFVIAQIPIHSNSAFQLQPIIKHASSHLIQKYEVMKPSVTILQYSRESFSLAHIIYYLFICGLIIAFYKYCNNILILRKYITEGYCQRKFFNIHIVFSDKTAIPFCYSFLKSHYVIMPLDNIKNNSDLKIAIRHEFQHIRQGDTYWLHFLAIVNVLCFWNPFVKFWQNWFTESQEFACDEVLVLNKNASRINYAQCLIDTASRAVSEKLFPQGSLGMIGARSNFQSMLNRRVDMLFNYKTTRKKNVLFCAYAMCFLTATSFSYAFDTNSAFKPFNAAELKSISTKSSAHFTFTPEVLAEINNIRGSEQARSYLLASLQRMNKYKPYIESQLKTNHIPTDLLALPLIESGYKPLPQSKNPMHAAGIWQFIPSTAKRFDLIINAEQDDRLDCQLSTQAAVAYLNSLYAKYHDWKLSAIAYEYGDEITDHLINMTHSHEAWSLARSAGAPKDLTKFLSLYEAAIIIMNHPELLNS